MSNQRTALLFGGAWSRGHEHYWMRHPAQWYKDRGYRVIVLRYPSKARTPKALIDNIVQQLRDSAVLDEDNMLLEQVLGVAYSMGGDILRLLAAMFPNLFYGVELLASTNRFGMGWPGIIRGIETVPLEFFGGILSWQGVALSNPERVRQLMFNDMEDSYGFSAACELIEYSAREPAACVLNLLPITHRLIGSTQALTCPVVAVRPRLDLIFLDAHYPGENVHVVSVAGGHGFLLRQGMCYAALEAAARSPNFVES